MRPGGGPAGAALARRLTGPGTGALLALVLLGGCAPAAAPAPGAAPADRGPGLTLEEVGAHRRSRDFFALRDRLAATGDTARLAARVARAAVDHAFNRPAASNRAIAAALRDPALPDTLDLQLREIEATNHVRLHRYADALAAADALLRRHEGRRPAEELEDIRNLRKIVAALAGSPPQTVRVDGPSRIRLERGRIPVTVGDSTRSWVFDTGANLSTIMRSEAAALGLDIRQAGIEVGTATDARIIADAGIARSLRIGRMEFRNVAFLVVDDAALTFGDFRIPGIIGFPVIEAMGEIRAYSGGALEVPLEPPLRPLQNLALAGLTPLTTVRWEGSRLVCRLDTGAGTTDFYEPFYRRFRERLEPIGTPTSRRSGGVGGVRELPVLEVTDVAVALGDTTAVLDTVDVLTRRIVPTEEENFLACNIGHDILDQFTAYVLNFRDMSFLLR